MTLLPDGKGLCWLLPSGLLGRVGGPCCLLFVCLLALPSLLPQTLGSPAGFEDVFGPSSVSLMLGAVFVGCLQEPVNQVVQCAKPQETSSQPYLQT